MIVLDSSILSGVFFEEEAAAAVFGEIESSGRGGLVAPDFVALELANAVISNRRRMSRRAESAAGNAASDRLYAMPTSLLADEIRRRLALADLVLEPAITERRFARAMQISELHRLSMYDACYIALAEELRAALATLDGAMQTAARDLGISVLPSGGPSASGSRVN